MKNKGFTLVELLAVIAVLLILITLITPKVINQLNSSEDVTQKEQINTLINIAKIYTNQNTEKLPENNSISVITIQELKESGLINKSQILDPKTKEELTGCILIKDENNKYNYEYNEDTCNNLITVTFDPQGGQLDQTSKNVIPNETYGELPTPTKEGYTFMGWNGKNLINANLYKGVYEINGQIQAQDSNIYKYSELTEMLPSGNYVISCKDDNITIVRVYLSNDNIITRYGDKLPKQIQLTNNSKVGFSFRESEASDKIWSIGDNTIDAKIQLEEGSVSTPYEPYYITPSTTVVQENNHTLKAIWQANS